jgi:hypothetical protein
MRYLYNLTPKILRRRPMNRRKHSIIICLLSLTFLLVASQPIFAAERIIKMVVPGCE